MESVSTGTTVGTEPHPSSQTKLSPTLCQCSRVPTHTNPELGSAQTWGDQAFRGHLPGAPCRGPAVPARPPSPPRQHPHVHRPWASGSRWAVLDCSPSAPLQPTLHRPSSSEPSVLLTALKAKSAGLAGDLTSLLLHAAWALVWETQLILPFCLLGASHSEGHLLQEAIPAS